MYTLLLCLLLVSACASAPANLDIAQRSAGKDLLKALKGAALTSVENSLTSVIDTTINKAVTKLTDEVGHVATNLLSKIHLGHLHLGKRNIFKDLLHGVEQSVVGIEQSALNSLTGIANEKLNTLIGKLGRRSLGQELLHTLEQSLFNTSKATVDTLSTYATDKLNSLIEKLRGRRNLNLNLNNDLF